MVIIKRSDIERKKAPSAHMRVYPDGRMRLSFGMAERMGLEEGDRLSFFSEDGMYYVAKSNRDESYGITTGMCMHSRDMATRLFEVFGEEEDISIRLGIPPEFETRKEQHGTELYRLHRI